MISLSSDPFKNSEILDSPIFDDRVMNNWIARVLEFRVEKEKATLEL